MIFIHESNDVTVRFGLGFLEELHLLKESCRFEAYAKEKQFEEEVQYMLQYQKETIDMLDSLGVPGIEGKDEIRSKLQKEMQELFDRQDILSKELRENCTQRYESIINEKLVLAIEYARTILDNGLMEYVHFINHITDYSKKLQHGLDQCINNYAPSFPQNPPSNDICMVIEMEGLINFVKSFIAESRILLINFQSKERSTNITSSKFIK